MNFWFYLFDQSHFVCQILEAVRLRACVCLFWNRMPDDDDPTESVTNIFYFLERDRDADEYGLQRTEI